MTTSSVRLVQPGTVPEKIQLMIAATPTKERMVVSNAPTKVAIRSGTIEKLISASAAKPIILSSGYLVVPAKRALRSYSKATCL